VIAASVADPIVEFCSNAGLFGPGEYTDQSNLDVFPALLAGLAILTFYFVRRAPAILAGNALSRDAIRLLPAILALQFAALYLMETAEQLVVWGHPLSATTWLGAPLPISAAFHVAVALAVLAALVASKRTLAATTLRVIRLIRAIATFAAVTPQPSRPRRPARSFCKELFLALCAIGERAPPLATR